VKAYLVTVLVIDFDGLGSKGVEVEMENVRYPNRCLTPHVEAVEEFDIGPWDDDHPLNQRGTDSLAYLKSLPREGKEG